MSKQVREIHKRKQENEQERYGNPNAKYHDLHRGDFTASATKTID
jgi:hypothetical protein